MLKLLKIDMSLILNDKNKYIKGILLLFILYGFSIKIDAVEFGLLNLPIFVSIFTSFENNPNEVLSRKYSFFQSLPIKRWEMVLSKYIMVIVKFILFIIYLVIVLNLLYLLGFDSLQYIETIFMRETFTFWIISLAIIIPIMLIHLGAGRIFFVFLVTSITTRMYEGGLEGYGGFESLFQMSNLKLLSIVLIAVGVSIWLSLYFYNIRDLG